MNAWLAESLAIGSNLRRPLGRAIVMAAALLSLFGLGMAMGRTQAAPAARPQAQAPLQFNTLRVHGYAALGHPDDPPYGNWPATAGSNSNRVSRRPIQ